MEAGGRTPREGDAALAALLLVHGMIMNGGLDHALETLSAAEYAAGIVGFRYFGLFKAAAILAKARDAKEAEFGQLNSEYGKVVRSDSDLVDAFELKLRASPDAFFPVRQSDV